MLQVLVLASWPPNPSFIAMFSLRMTNALFLSRVFPNLDELPKQSVGLRPHASWMLPLISSNTHVGAPTSQ